MIPSIAKHIKSDKKSLFLLDKCLLTMDQLKQIHAHLIISGTVMDPFASGKIIAFCAISSKGDLNYAHLVFQHLHHPTKFVWNTMIRAFVERSQPLVALSLNKKMLSSGYLPNNYTFSFLLKACIAISSLCSGQLFHAQIVRLGWQSYDFVFNGLIHMYLSCGCIESARKLFKTSMNRDVVSWTAMVDGYAKLGQIDEARRLFDQMPERNVVTWSSMINCYMQIGMFKEALEFFNNMQLGGFEPNHAGIVAALAACASIGALEQGRWIHTFVERNKMELDRVLGTALVDMYAKCGCIETASTIFNNMVERDVYAWTSMISGLANHGNSEEAITLFFAMKEKGIKPNEVTFICVLNACSRVGLVEDGKKIFESMTSVHGIEPGVAHYGCLVDLLGCAGKLEEAKKVVLEMPMEPDSYVLGALLNACRVHGKVEFGEETVKSLAGLQCDHGGVFVLLSNMYAACNRWEDVARLRKDMEERNVNKVPGCSLIEVDGTAIEFVAGSASHFLHEETIMLLNGMNKQLKFFECRDDDLW